MNIHTETCPICDEGSLHEVGCDRVVEYKGRHGQVHSKSSVCDVCGCVQASSTQVRDNQRAMTYFRKEVDGRLTGQQMRDTRIELGLTQVQAAAIFGGGPNSFAKYEADDVTQSEAMDNLVRLASEVPAAKQWLFSKASVKELHKAAEQTLEQQFYNINIGMIFGSRTAPRLPWVMSSLESSTYNSSLRSQIEKRLIPYHQSVELGATQTAVHVVAGVVERKIRLYGEEENIQSLLSPRYSEEEYDRHTRR